MHKDVFSLSAPATTAEGSIRAQVDIPGSKSFTNRALIMAALSCGNSQLQRASLSDDSRALLNALRQLGLTYQQRGTQISVTGLSSFESAFRGEVDVGPAGTSCRFLCALFAGLAGCEVTLKGSERLHMRPIADLVNALRGVGARIEYLGRDGCPPLAIHGQALPGGRVAIPGSTSSQFFSALLLCSPLFTHGLEIEVQGEQISRSYIDMTLQSMRDFGISVSNENYRRYSVPAGARYQARNYCIEGDGSGASYFWGIAAVNRGCIRVLNINPESAQGDVHFPQLLAQMGCQLRSGFEHAADGSRVGWIEIQGAPLTAIDADLTLLPDCAQTLAVVAACASGRSTLRGLSTLRIKETDRIAALQTELAKLGVETSASADSLSIEGLGHECAALRPARIATYEDHRMAMSFAVLAGRFNGLQIEEPQVVTKSFPDFWERLQALGIGVQRIS
jgi:3-phosphoshikimate 1-carboxyvinyltransferase